MSSLAKAGLVAAALLSAGVAQADESEKLAALEGLAPVAVLQQTDSGKAALAANLKVTADIQTGDAGQPLLLPFADQQKQALRDAFITSGNGLELTDGLGSALETAYHTLTSYKSADGGKTSSFTSLSPAVARVFAYAYASASADSNAGKYFFSNATTDGRTPVSAQEAAISTRTGGVSDIFGTAYGRPAGSAGADPFGNSRPFQTEPRLREYTAIDFFGAETSNKTYLRGPIQDLTSSPAYPSGHTTYGYTESLVLAFMFPQRYQQMIARGADYGHDRIVVGAHYAMDVLAGRALASYDMAHLLAGAKGYLGEKRGGAKIEDFREAIAAAAADAVPALEKACGGKIAACAQQDEGRFADLAADEAFYESTQIYGLPTIYPEKAADKVDVAAIAPEAGYLLIAAFPKLTLAKADAILTETEGPGGGFLDNGSAFGLYSRLDLFKAGGEAARAAKETNRDLSRPAPSAHGL